MTNLAGLKVLVVDDAMTITRASEIYLAGKKENPSGIIVRTANNGFDALPEMYDFMPDIILLDVVTPKVNGFIICKAIKNNPKLKNIRVIILTSKGGLFDRGRGMDAGADDYIEKPFQRDSILLVVEQHAPTRFKQLV